MPELQTDQTRPTRQTTKPIRKKTFYIRRGASSVKQGARSVKRGASSGIRTINKGTRIATETGGAVGSAASAVQNPSTDPVTMVVMGSLLLILVYLILSHKDASIAILNGIMGAFNWMIKTLLGKQQ